jgi:hypothetical protein
MVGIAALSRVCFPSPEKTEREVLAIVFPVATSISKKLRLIEGAGAGPTPRWFHP